MTATRPHANGSLELETRDTDMSEELREVINEKTRVPIGIAVACAIAFIGGALWLNSRLDAIDHRLVAMEKTLLDRWTGSDMKIWTLEFKMANPNLTVPDTQRIKPIP